MHLTVHAHREPQHQVTTKERIEFIALYLSQRTVSIDKDGTWIGAGTDKNQRQPHHAETLATYSAYITSSVLLRTTYVHLGK